MYRQTLRSCLLLILSFWTWPVLGQGDSRKLAHRIDRYEFGASHEEVKEAAYRLTGYIGERDDEVAVRVCSREPMPLALATAAANPFDVAAVLVGGYAYSTKRIMFLRSEDCLSQSSMVPPTEIWAIPKGAPLPSHVQVIASDAIHSKSLGVPRASIMGHPDYRSAARRLVAELKRDPTAVGIVLGYYIDKPRPGMSRRLREVKRILERGRIEQNRFFIRLTPWNDYVSLYPRDVEPKYPSVFLIN